MLIIKAAIKQHAVLIYFALVFVLSGGGILLIVGPDGIPLKAEEFASFGPLMYAAILEGPWVGGANRWQLSRQPLEGNLVSRH